MSRTRAVTSELTHELTRLADAERAAFATHDIPTFIHCRLRWCELVLTLCPGMSAASPGLASRVAHLLPDRGPALPRWKVEQQARPLVPIVRRTVRTITLPSGAVSHSCTEYLACGHVHQLAVMLPGEALARRRRCRDCGAMRLLAQDKRAHSLHIVGAKRTGKIVPITTASAALNLKRRIPYGNR